jgi:hypothetical protein
MKHLYILFILLLVSTVTHANCGACDIGEEKKTQQSVNAHKKHHAHAHKKHHANAHAHSNNVQKKHPHAKKITLNQTQQKAVDNIKKEYYEDKAKLKEAYKKKLSKILTKEQLNTYFTKK